MMLVRGVHDFHRTLRLTRRLRRCRGGHQEDGDRPQPPRGRQPDSTRRWRIAALTKLEVGWLRHLGALSRVDESVTEQHRSTARTARLLYLMTGQGGPER